MAMLKSFFYGKEDEKLKMMEEEENSARLLCEKAINDLKPLPTCITLDIETSVFDHRSEYSRQEFSSEKELTQSQNETAAKTKSRSAILDAGIQYFGAAGSASKSKTSNTQMKEDVKISCNEAAVSTHHFTYMKKITVKPTLDNTVTNTAKQIISSPCPKERMHALNRTLKWVEHYKKNETIVRTRAYFCGGRFTVDATAVCSKETEHGLLVQEAKNITDKFLESKAIFVEGGVKVNANMTKSKENAESTEVSEHSSTIQVTLKHRSQPSNCESEDELTARLERGVEYWSLFPDLNEPLSETKIDVIEMMKQKAIKVEDNTLFDAARFLESYLEYHDVFVFIGEEPTMRKVIGSLAECNQRSVALLFHESNSVLSLQAEEDISAIKKNVHSGSNVKIIICVQKDKDILKTVGKFMDLVKSHPLNKVFLLNMTTFEDKIQRRKITKYFGIKNIIVSNLKKGPEALVYQFQKSMQNPQTQLLNQTYAEFRDMKDKKPESDVSPEDINILLLGETGVGKSTWINALANYVKFSSFDDAAENSQSVKWNIPARFTFRKKEVIIGYQDKNEVLEAGESATQFPKEYKFVHQGKRYCVIDTPGIGDTRGIEHNDENFENIMTFLSHYPKLHAVCILFKNNEPRLTISFKYCILQLLNHLHKTAAKNIIFGFTNSRASWFEPGTALGSLQKLLEENKDVNIRLEQNENYFCFDSETFEVLVGIKNGHKYTRNQMKTYADSWDSSKESVLQMFEIINGMTPHDTSKTITLNGAKALVNSLTKPLGEILGVIEDNKRQCEKVQREISNIKNEVDVVLASGFLVFKIDMINLKNPQTVCTHKDCVEKLSIGNTSEVNVHYKTICHKKCIMKHIKSGTTNSKYLWGCSAFNYLGQDCKKCGHDYRDHMHIRIKTEKKLEEALTQEAREKINSKIGFQAKRDELLKRIENKIEEMKKEFNFIKTTQAHFAIFMAEKALVKENTSYVDYIDEALRTEEDETIKDKYMTRRKEHLQEVELLQRPRGEYQLQNIESEDIFKIKEELCGLAHFGAQIRDILDSENGQMQKKAQGDYEEEQRKIEKRNLFMKMIEPI